MKASLKKSLEELNERHSYPADRRITCVGDVSPSAKVEDVREATHVLVMLTDTHSPKEAPWLAAGTPANAQLVWAVQNIRDPKRDIVFVYDKPKGLNSNVFSLSDTIKPDAVKFAIWGHEALVFRPDGPPLAYEHESMVRHIVSLMEP